MKYGTASLWSFGLLMLPGTALAAWGENWGEMVWGIPVSVPSVPAVGLFVLALALLTTAGLRLRARKASHSALAILVVPMLAGVLSSPAHADVTIPNTFTDGTPALAAEVNENFQTLAGAVNSSECATSAEVVCAPALTCPDCGSSFFYDQAVAEGVASVDITTDNAVVAAAAAAAVDITTDNAAVCTTAGGTWEAGTSTCTPAPAASGYNCFVGGFCAQAAILFPPASHGYTNVYDGDTQATEPALGAGCNTGTRAVHWVMGQLFEGPAPPFTGPSPITVMCQ